MLRNIIYIISSIVVFFSGIVVYGIIINLREITLEEAKVINKIDKITNPSIIVDRKNYTLNLYSDTTLVKKYNAVFGRNKGSLKLSSDDYITPQGRFKICRINSDHTYYKKMYLDFPRISDAAEALKMKIISRNDFMAISESIKATGCSSDISVLGSDIGIQGIGEYNIIFKNLPFVFNWTNGSIAISNENIDELLSVVDVGTEVTIKN